MTQDAFFHKGQRDLQDAFDSRALADRLQSMKRIAFTEDDKAYIESVIYFFLATADAEGHPDCSFKGGPQGFVRVTAPDELAFPDYDGNGMFRSLGNIGVNPHVGMLFINMHGTPKRLRVNGEARVSTDDPLMAETVGAQMIIRVKATAIFPNCPRYIPVLEMDTPSPYTPVPGGDPVEPAWKGFDVFKDAVPPRKPTFKG